MPRMLLDAQAIDTIQRALLDADAFVLARGKSDQQQSGSFINPLSDCPLRSDIGDALIALGAVRACIDLKVAGTRSTKTKYVARFTTGRYACRGHETGMGESIESTDDISKARLSDSVVGLMTWMGGHYRGTVAVPVTITTDVNIAEPVAYPDEATVWPDHGR